MSKNRTPRKLATASLILSNGSAQTHEPLYESGLVRSEARCQASRALAAVLQSSTANWQVMTVDDLIGSFVTSLRWRTLTSVTQRHYELALRRLSAAMGTKPVMAVTTLDAKAFHDHVAAAGPRSGSRPRWGVAREAVRVARRLWNFGRSYGVCRTNPFDTIRIEPRVAGPVIWTLDQVVAFIAAADAATRPEIGTAAALAFWLFLREGEVLAIRAGF